MDTLRSVDHTTPASALEAFVERSARWHAAAVALIAFAGQLIVLAPKDNLIFEWRPTDLGAIALNYYRNGFHLFYPQVLWGGSGPGYVEMEFPLLPFGVALLYAVFGIRDWVALLLPMACGLALPLVMLAFTRRAFGRTAGVVAGLFVALSPAWLAMSAGLWPDAPPVLFGAIGLLLLWQWTDDGRSWRLVTAAASVSLAILLKLTALYLGLPVLWLFVARYGRAWWRAWPVWAFAVVVLVPPALWYAHAYGLYRSYGNTFGIIASGYMKFGDAETLLDPGFYARTAARVALFHTTPLGLVLVLAGLFARPRARISGLVEAWLAAVLVYFVIAARGVSLGHYQYALPVVAPCAMLAGRGVLVVARALEVWARQAHGAPAARVAGAALVTLLAANAAAANLLYELRGTASSHQSALKMRTGDRVARLTAPGSLILVVDARMDDVTPERSMTPPEVFYFGGRRGWYRSMAWLTPESIEDLRGQGAQYLVVSANYVGWFRDRYAELYRSCRGRYRTLMDDDAGIIYDLTARP